MEGLETGGVSEGRGGQSGRGGSSDGGGPIGSGGQLVRSHAPMGAAPIAPPTAPTAKAAAPQASAAACQTREGEGCSWVAVRTTHACAKAPAQQRTPFLLSHPLSHPHLSPRRLHILPSDSHPPPCRRPATPPSPNSWAVRPTSSPLQHQPPPRPRRLHLRQVQLHVRPGRAKAGAGLLVTWPILDPAGSSRTTAHTHQCTAADPPSHT